MADNTLASLLARNALGYGETPVLDSLQGDGTTYDTADILRRVRKPNALVEALRVAQSSIPENKEHSISLVNMLRGGLGTAANWLEGNPEIGPDTLAPLGAGLIGSAFAPQNALGIFGGRLAKTADHAALAKAEEMAAKGADRKAIWDQTGWFQGADGKWRFEIDDSQASLTKSLKDFADTQKSVPLSDAYRHDDLYAAYPNVASDRLTATSQYRPGEGAYANFTKDGVTYPLIALGYKASRSGDSDILGLGTLTHELQHRVQDIEGFAPGGTNLMGHPRAEVERAARAAYEGAPSANEIDDLLRQLEIDAGPPSAPKDKKAWEDMTPREKLAWNDRGRDWLYRRLAGEVESRNATEREMMFPNERRAKPPWETQEFPEAEQIIRKR